MFDHQKLPVYPKAIAAATHVGRLAEQLGDPERKLRDRLGKASLSMVIHIVRAAYAESPAEAAREFRTARRRATECALRLDVNKDRFRPEDLVTARASLAVVRADLSRLAITASGKPLVVEYDPSRDDLLDGYV